MEDVPDKVILKLVSREIHRAAKDCARRQALGWIQLEDNRMLGCTHDEMLQSRHREEYIKQFRNVYLIEAREQLGRRQLENPQPIPTLIRYR